MKMSQQWMTGDVMQYEILKENAKQNRKNMTDAEQAFWSCVKGKSLGQRCLRQHVIGSYIVDFLFCKSKVIVEIDGGYHYEQRRLSESPCIGRLLDPTIPTNPTYIDQVEEDRIRQDWLESMGYKVVRFKNEEVLFDTENTIKKLKQIL